jgi:hypothetical protein
MLLPVLRLYYDGILKERYKQEGERGEKDQREEAGTRLGRNRTTNYFKLLQSLPFINLAHLLPESP